MPLGFVSRQLLQQQNTRCFIGRGLFYVNIEWIQEVNKTFWCLHNEYLCTQWQVGYPLAMITAVHSLYMVWIGRWWPSLGCPQVFNRVKIWTHIWSRLYICITLLQEVFSLFRCVYTSPIMLDIWIWCWGQKVAQEKVEEHCQYIGQLLYHSLNLDQYVETQWGQVEQSNAMLPGPPKEPLSSIQSSK